MEKEDKTRCCSLGLFIGIIFFSRSSRTIADLQARERQRNNQNHSELQYTSKKLLQALLLKRRRHQSRTGWAARSLISPGWQLPSEIDYDVPLPKCGRCGSFVSIVGPAKKENAATYLNGLDKILLKPISKNSKTKYPCRSLCLCRC